MQVLPQLALLPFSNNASEDSEFVADFGPFFLLSYPTPHSGKVDFILRHSSI